MTALVRFGLGFFLVFSALFLIALILIQRGRGGGLAGAFGGMGGQSAFGTKAGDVFTKITVIAAACWILLCILALNVLGRRQSLFDPSLGAAAATQAVPAASTVPPAAADAPAAPSAPGDSSSGGSDSTGVGAATGPAAVDAPQAEAAAPAATPAPAAEPK